MVILIYLGVYLASIIISTLVLGATLFLVEDIKESSFKDEGVLVTWAKCASIVTGATLLSLIPFGFIVAIVLSFIAVMAFFRKTFGQAFLLLFLNGFFAGGVYWLIEKILVALL